MADTAHHQILKDSGLSVTAQRLALMDAVATHPHATTDELTCSGIFLFSSFFLFSFLF